MLLHLCDQNSVKFVKIFDSYLIISIAIRGKGLKMPNRFQKLKIEDGQTIQRPKENMTNNDVQNITQKTKDSAT
jgi:hypothetical protein